MSQPRLAKWKYTYLNIQIKNMEIFVSLIQNSKFIDLGTRWDCMKLHDRYMKYALK